MDEETRLNERVEKLEVLVLEMAATIKVLTAADERAKEFVARIDEIAASIKTNPRP
jgi:hypothetical protein